MTARKCQLLNPDALSHIQTWLILSEFTAMTRATKRKVDPPEQYEKSAFPRRPITIVPATGSYGIWSR